MRTREQKGYVWKAGDWWWIRYADTVVENGVATRKQIARKLAPVMAEHKRLTRAPESVLAEQERFMSKINDSRNQPEHNVTVSDFARNVWKPYIENRHAASTVHHYGYYWDHILDPRCGREMLRDFSTPGSQSLLENIARQNPTMKKNTLRRLKSILSAIFKLAIQQGYRPGPNPVRETSLPRAPESEETVAYDIETVLAMLRVVPEPSRTVIAVAAFSGLRCCEIEGLQWESYDGNSLKVLRGMWRGIAGETKSKASKASVPVIAPLRNLLDQHRLRCGNPETGIMFKSRRNTPLSLVNLCHDYIRPALRNAKPEIAWHGFHAFRRGLATNLHALGVDDLTIQKILRHSDVSVTQRFYIKTLSEQSVAAMKKLEISIEDSLVCNESANEAEESKLIH
jgi:integrase